MVMEGDRERGRQKKGISLFLRERSCAYSKNEQQHSDRPGREAVDAEAVSQCCELIGAEGGA
jgi:hypothetical protein